MIVIILSVSYKSHKLFVYLPQFKKTKMYSATSAVSSAFTVGSQNPGPIHPNQPWPTLTELSLQCTAAFSQLMVWVRVKQIKHLKK